MLRRLLVVALTGLAALACAMPAQALQLGFNDEDLLTPATASGTGATDAGMALGLQHARGAGASIWRLQLRWSSVAAAAPPNAAVAADPAWSGYDWSAIDRKVRAVVGAGFQPLLWVDNAPAWAEGPHRPAVSEFAPAGSWRPNAAALQAFAQAVATRYRGDFPDPLAAGTTLPRVGTYQAWNEPNLYVEITPQYVKSGKRWVPAGPAIFRSLVNAVYAGVKAADPRARVGAGSTAPFGDYPAGGHRVPPVELWRDLLCLRQNGRTLKQSASCPAVHFDFYAHNPYSPYAPTHAALNADDVTVPDLGKLTTLVRRGVAAGTIQPKAAKPLWITELGWDSNPPDPQGVSTTAQAHYEEGAISVLAREGAQAILFWNARDDAPVPSYDETYQSGIYTRGLTVAQDVMKMSYTAFRFPFTAYRYGGTAMAWGKAAASGPVSVQRYIGAGWRPIATPTAGADGVFSKRLHVATGTLLRAVQSAQFSLSWRSR